MLKKSSDRAKSTVATVKTTAPRSVKSTVKTSVKAPAKAKAEVAAVTAVTATTVTEVKTIATAPTREQIATRAYEIYLGRGQVAGHELEDWAQAERELFAKLDKNSNN